MLKTADGSGAGAGSGEGKVFKDVHVSGNGRVVLGNVAQPAQGDEREEVEAETYVWIGGEENLEAREWDFAEFQREKLRFWAGDEEYAGKFCECDG